MIREAFSIILRLRGDYMVTTAENGQVALDLCKQNTYDVILLDIMMPVLDGIGFLKQYTALFPDKLAKVVIMSNLSSGAELSEAQDYGIERSVLKSSLTPGALLAVVAETIEGKQNDMEQRIDSSAPINRDDTFPEGSPVSPTD
jgi:DNA-binding NarL/FixJ family response regulator